MDSYHSLTNLIHCLNQHKAEHDLYEMRTVVDKLVDRTGKCLHSLLWGNEWQMQTYGSKSCIYNR